MDYSRRGYRRQMKPDGFVSFEVKIKETDLHVAVDEESFNGELVRFTESRVLYYRAQLEDYIRLDPLFRTTLVPHLVRSDAPPVALAMARAGNSAGVGPMAAVAGTLAELIGYDLLCRVKQVIVENGGDIFLKTATGARIAVFAGESPFSNRVALELPAREAPYGICTSSGTVGPSLSFGRADAAVIVSASAPLADAVATAAGNLVSSAADLPAALEFARNIPGVEGVLVIKEDKMAAWGTIRLIPLGR